MHKQDIRKALKEKLHAISPEKKEIKQQKIFSRLSPLIHSLNFRYLLSNEFCAGLFAPLADEVNCVEYKEWKVISFPSFSSNDSMTFKKCSFEDLKESDEFGVKLLCPPSELEDVVPELLVVPGLGFTKNGERLGRGKGFYDRFLESYQGIKIALVFEEQILEKLPVEEHDVNVDYVVSEKGVWKQGEALKL
ncbi:MAG: 5-formyltetrahydrofolate cyclo-ligase [Oligoflexia bacterium]|nr:5-formyltetrahydrofolate cyclo-ligase [Oligoflexia bacterium]